MCKIYDFEKLKSKAKAVPQSEHHIFLKRRIVDLSIQGAAELALWEETDDKRHLDNARKALEGMQLCVSEYNKSLKKK